MKKVLLLLAFLPILFACSSSEDEFVPTGTYSSKLTNFFEGNQELTYNIRFMSGNKYEFTYRVDDFVSGMYTIVSTYTLDYPQICFHEFDDGEDAVGTFLDERTLRVNSHEYIKK